MFASLIVPVAANGRAFVFITARRRIPGQTGPEDQFVRQAEVGG